MAANTYTPEEKAILRKIFFRSHRCFMMFSMAKMEANCFTMCMQPVIESLYPDDKEEQRRSYLRHQAFFNTHTNPFTFIAGLTYAMEKERKEGKVDEATIDNVKAALMGPTAGMFDSFWFNAVRVISAGIAIGLCSQGNFLGTILFVLLYGVTQSISKWYLLQAGYNLGTSFIDTVFNSGLVNVLTKCASVVGLTMVGAMTANMVNVPLNWVINTTGKEGGEVVVSNIVNSIFPGLLGVILLFVLVRLIKKGYRPTQLIAGIFVLALVGALLGIF
ncbi:MAG: PTS system mannose/fructose/sorbose family transporter subunit IID [Erysipelotrichaceae bacterium]|nr:PTS system mannose/fructose/sorbose family transporter subunit IID [Erysipelotrichaceae bacterium]MBQ1324021.1 PTS system mannose/fructose/sorbose family transporter subunit IID [Erysipelotrichaceae bacterium]MBQ1774747.1 PTS system mannose/fructose/sorbose family transporter subunit IID [Erysipelotrichaceae bacterium]MBQ1911056.1 PTS system mannose/fructose/sorbose family transporter subunit IID [Erysipelotrichaceae bacterium]MBQ2079815.1 PTS system mannose/fructose/sorbose family transport